MTVPVFVVTGFLDSGKTTLVKETLMQQEWIEDGRTLLICCEEGEEEYSEEYLKEKDIVKIQVEEFEELSYKFFKECKKHNAVQVVIEYNGMWSLEELLSIRFPRNWELQGVYSTVNGMTLDMYLKNMRNVLMEQLTESELIVVNRCSQDVNRAGFRRAVKVQNPMAQLIFEDLDGKIIQPSEEDLPYDVKGDKIVIEDDDFGIWFVDACDHPKYYLHKEIEFKAQAFRPKLMKNDMFVPMRRIMTCCADDVGIYGYPCKLDKPISFEQNEWIKVRVRFEYESYYGDGDMQPILYLLEMEKAEKPEEEIVYLG
ncbi:MAG: GTP-binding protein [Dorea sp.]